MIEKTGTDDFLEVEEFPLLLRVDKTGHFQDQQCIFRVRESFDIFFLDPPYHSEEINKVLPLIGEKGLLSENGLVIVEHFFKKKMSETSDKLKRSRSYRYGDTMLTLYRKVRL